MEQMIYYDDIGTGPPIIFLHPPGMGRKVFIFQEQLADQFRVILPDLSGHGDSVVRTKKVTIKSYADEVKELMDHLNIDEAFICGYSAASNIAQQFAISYPNHVTGLILSGGYPKVETSGLKLEYQLGMALLKRNPKLLTSIIAKSHTKDMKVRKAIGRHMLKANKRVWYQFYNESFKYDCSAVLYMIKAPVLLFYGNRVPWISKNLSCYRHIKDCTPVVIKGASHQIPTQNWEIFNSEIRQFVSSHLEKENSETISKL